MILIPFRLMVGLLFLGQSIEVRILEREPQRIVTENKSDKPKKGTIEQTTIDYIRKQKFKNRSLKK